MNRDTNIWVRFPTFPNQLDLIVVTRSSYSMSTPAQGKDQSKTALNISNLICWKQKIFHEKVRQS